MRLLAAGVVVFLCAVTVAADELRVAVASNAANALSAVARDFETQSAHRIVLIAGSTGKLYAQIVHGAPFDAFFAADVERPQRLERDDRTVAGSRFTYARGRLVLWSIDPDRIDSTHAALDADVRFVAIANPELAPYGRASREVLQALGLWETVQDRLVRGENITQTFQFVRSGNAALGFVARSQVVLLAAAEAGSAWAVPDSLHAPIEQQAVLLRDSEAGHAFFEHCRNDAALRILRRYGYDVP